MSHLQLKADGCTHIIKHNSWFGGEIFIYGEAELTAELRDLSLRNITVSEVVTL